MAIVWGIVDMQYRKEIVKRLVNPKKRKVL